MDLNIADNLMREFLKPHRRKLGVVTLLMTCMFMGMWTRSFYVEDMVTVEDAGLLVASILGRIEWAWKTPFEEAIAVPRQMIVWESNDVRFIPADYSDLSNRVLDQEVPYRWIVTPLTIISAILLLSKPWPGKPPVETT